MVSLTSGSDLPPQIVVVSTHGFYSQSTYNRGILWHQLPYRIDKWGRISSSVNVPYIEERVDIILSQPLLMNVVRIEPNAYKPQLTQ